MISMNNKTFKKILYSFPIILILLSPTTILSWGLLTLSGNQFSNVFLSIVDITLLFYILLLITSETKKINASLFLKNVVFITIFFVYIIISYVRINAEYIYLLDGMTKINRFLLGYYYIRLLISRNIVNVNDLFQVFLISFIILSLASPLSITFYSIYSDQMQRAGSIGITPNYLALISSFLILSTIFLKKYKFLVFLSGILGVLFSASRRGIFITLIFIMLILIVFIFRGIKSIGNKKKISKLLYNVFLSLLILISFIFTAINFDNILIFIYDNFPLFYRFDFSQIFNANIYTDNVRSIIYSDSVELFKNNLFGLMGSDLYVAHIFAYGHTHNVFMQIFIEFGIIVGTIIVFTLMFYFLRYVKFGFSTEITRFAYRRQYLFFLSFLSVYLVFDYFGYSLWSIKSFYILVFVIGILTTVSKTSLPIWIGGEKH